MADIGSVSVRVVPNAENFVRKLNADLTPGIKELSTKIGDELTKDIARKLRDAIGKGLGEGVLPAKVQGKRTGDAFADTFGRTVKTKIEAALKSLPKGKINLDDVEAQAKIAELRSALKDISGKAKLGLSDADVLASVAKIKAELDDLAHNSPDIRVRVDSAAASAKLAEMAAEIKALDAQDVNINVKTDSLKKAGGDVKGNTGLLGVLKAAILTIGPALVPLGAATIGFGAALGAAAGVGILAFKGIGNEMKAGTALGLKYTAQLGLLKADYLSLARVAATGVFSGIARGVGSIQKIMPQLSSETKVFSGLLGQAAANLVHGLGGALIGLNPLFTTILRDVVSLTGHLDSAASGGGLKSFGAYIQANLPAIEHTLSSLGTTIGHVFEAFAPQGAIIIRVIGQVADAINALPIGPLAALATAASSTYLAFKVYSGLNAILGGAAAKMLAFAAAENVAAVSGKAAAVSSESAAAAAALQGNAALVAGEKGLAGAVAGGAGFSRLGTFVVGAGGALTRVVPQIAAATTALLALKIAQDQAASHKNDGGVSGALASVGNTLLGNHQIPGGKTFSLTHGIQDAPDYRAANAAKAAAAAAAAQQEKADLAAADAEATLNLQTSITAVAMKELATRLGISSATADQYAATLGFAKNANGTFDGSLVDVSKAIATVTAAYANGNSAQGAYLAALSTFSTSAGTAADKATFIGATLKASQGDALGFAGAMVGAATANQSFVTGFTKAEAGTVKYTRGIHGALKASVDYKNAAAGPLIAGLQGIQDAATAAASATFLHEKATKGGATAARDAAAVFKNDTYNGLIKDAGALGISTDKAKALAREYFKMPKSVTTKVIDVGTQAVITTLDRIGKLLATNTGQPWVSVLTAADHASKPIKDVHDLVNKVPTSHQLALIARDNASGLIKVVHDEVNKVPTSHQLAIIAIDNASGTISNVHDAVNNLPSSHTIDISTHYSYTTTGKPQVGGTNAYGGAYAHGGPVGQAFAGYAPGVDSIHAMVSPGEGVLVPEALKYGMGGAKGLYEFNARYAPRVRGHQSAYGFGLGGVMQRFANGGGPGGYDGVNPSPNAGGGKHKSHRGSSSGSGSSSSSGNSGTGSSASSKAAVRRANTAADAAEKKAADRRKAYATALTALTDTYLADLKAQGQKRSDLHTAGTAAGNQVLSDKGFGNLVHPDQTAFAATLSNIRSLGHEQGTKTSKTNAAVSRITSENAALNAAIKVRDGLAGQLAAARTKLTDALAAKAADKTAITDATKGSFDISSAGYADTYSIKSVLAGKVKQALQFGKDLATAAKRGVAQSLLTQLAQAGADAGAVSAHTLATANAADIKQINASNSALAAAAGSIGATVSAAGSDSAIGAARGRVATLSGQSAGAAASALALAKSLAKTVRDALTFTVPKPNAKNLAELRTVAAHLAKGLGLTTQMEQAGVSAAKGLAKGLLTNDKALSVALDGLSAKMITRLKKALGIKSPSTVMAGIGSNAGEGFNLGLASHIDPVGKTATALATAAHPSGVAMVHSNNNGPHVKRHPVRMIGKVHLVGDHLDMRDAFLEFDYAVTSNRRG